MDQHLWWMILSTWICSKRISRWWPTSFWENSGHHCYSWNYCFTTFRYLYHCWYKYSFICISSLSYHVYWSISFITDIHQISILCPFKSWRLKHIHCYAITCAKLFSLINHHFQNERKIQCFICEIILRSWAGLNCS